MGWGRKPRPKSSMRILSKNCGTAGWEFHVWTIDDLPLARRFLELGVDSITTNRPAYSAEKPQIGRSESAAIDLGIPQIVRILNHETHENKE